MNFIEWLDSPIGSKQKEKIQILQSDSIISDIPANNMILDIIIPELNLLYGHEASRFDSWTAKGTAMLGASGLLLSLSPLGWSIFKLANQALSLVEFWMWTAVLFVFLTTIGLFFLATWNSLISLRARPLCRLSEDELIPSVSVITQQDTIALRQRLAADKMTTYKNNITIGNLKGTKVNAAWKYFFYGCLTQILFLILAILAQTYFAN